MDGITDTKHEFEQAPGDGEGQGSLECYSPWGYKDLDTTEQLNNNKIALCCCLKSVEGYAFCFILFSQDCFGSSEDDYLQCSVWIYFSFCVYSIDFWFAVTVTFLSSTLYVCVWTRVYVINLLIY